MKYLVMVIASLCLFSCGKKQEEKAQTNPRQKVSYSPADKINIILAEIENFDASLYTSSESAIDNTITRFSNWRSEYKLNKRRIKSDSLLERNELILIKADEVERKSMPILRKGYADLLDKKLDATVSIQGKTITLTHPFFLAETECRRQHKQIRNILIWLGFKKAVYRVDSRRMRMSFEMG